eukprot:864327-Pelagomonas_calceolata.AAC.5
MNSLQHPSHPGSGAGSFLQPSGSPLAFSISALCWRGLKALLTQGLLQWMKKFWRCTVAHQLLFG